MASQLRNSESFPAYSALNVSKQLYLKQTLLEVPHREKLSAREARFSSALRLHVRELTSQLENHILYQK